MTSSRRSLPRGGRADATGTGSSAATNAAGNSAAVDGVELMHRTEDAFFRHIVTGMRNGILAITRAGNLALLNEEGYRIFGVESHPGDLGQPVAEVLRAHPDVVRLLLSAYELHLLPNRAELRLKATGKVIGYTLAFVR